MAQLSLSERIAIQEAHNLYTKEGIDEIKNILQTHVENEEAFEIRITTKLDALDKKYAFKWTETLILLLISGASLALMGYIIKTIISVSNTLTILTLIGI
jgi:hypothetical protein